MGDRMDFEDRNDLETQTTTREAQTPRQRAPTITIDKSAVSPPSATPIYCPGSLFSDEPSPLTQHHRSLFIEERPLLSSTLEPTLTASPNLLAVPDSSSRSGSLDHLSVTSYDGETLVTTPSLSIHGSSRRESHKLMSSLDLSVEQGDDDPLIPNPGTEHHFHVEDNPFAFSPGQLSKLFNPTSFSAFCALGGLQGIVLGLRTDSSSGLSLDETVLDGNVHIEDVTISATMSAFQHGQVPYRSTRDPSTTHAPTRHTSSELYADRKRVFGTSRLPERKSKTLLHIMWLAFNDKVLIILTVVACISLALGLYQDFGASSRFDEPKVRWVEGVTIMVAVALVVVVGSVNDYQKEQQFLKLNKKVRDSQIVPIAKNLLTVKTESRSLGRSYSIWKASTDLRI
jgi:Ca2+-transporting ATPase